MASRKRDASPSFQASPGRGLDLIKSRQHNGITLDQVVEKTKISIRFLRAIEAEAFDELPGGIFAVSYLRQYAAAIGIDPEPLVRHYEQTSAVISKPAEPESRPGLLGRLFRVPA